METIQIEGKSIDEIVSLTKKAGFEEIESINIGSTNWRIYEKKKENINEFVYISDCSETFIRESFEDSKGFNREMALIENITKGYAEKVNGVKEAKRFRWEYAIAPAIGMITLFRFVPVASPLGLIIGGVVSAGMWLSRVEKAETAMTDYLRENNILVGNRVADYLNHQLEKQEKEFEDSIKDVHEDLVDFKARKNYMR